MAAHFYDMIKIIFLPFVVIKLAVRSMVERCDDSIFEETCLVVSTVFVCVFGIEDLIFSSVILIVGSIIGWVCFVPSFLIV